MDKIEELYNLYLENGLISDATHIDVFRAASPEQREKLYNLGVQEGIFETTTLGDFNRPWFDAAGGAEKFVDVLESVKKKRHWRLGITVGGWFFGIVRSY